MRQLVLAALIMSFPLLVTAQTNEAAKASNRFAFNLYKATSKTEGNLFFSPFSIEVALAMTSAGAKEETLKQMRSALQLESTSHSDFKMLSEQLKGNKDYQLLVANRLWGRVGTPYHPDFLKLLRENYSADLLPLDFEKQTEASREKINQWVQQQTQEKIKDLLKPGTISKDTDLVLTNAIYFKGSWLDAFKKELTKEGEFHVSPTLKKTIPFMHTTEKYQYSENSELQYLQLPYKGKDLVMEVLLPKSGVQLSTIEQKLNPQMLGLLAAESTSNKIELSFPKFKAESEFNLGSTLSSMGMPLAFDKLKANFRGMRKLTGDENLYISKVVHKAFVDVNEEGTEAAAATAVVMSLTQSSISSQPKVFKADHPFLFFIRHVNSGAILFMGRYSKP